MMHLGSELRRIDQEAELEFRDSMQNQLEEPTENCKRKSMMPAQKQRPLRVKQ